MTKRILLVDDHEVLREGLKSLLAKLRPEWKICGEASDAEKAIQMVQELKPDLMILDISMPGMSGLDACARMRDMGIKTPVVIFTTHQHERLEGDVRQAGAQGYVMKSQAARDLVFAIDAILAGGTFFGPPRKTETSQAAKPKEEKDPKPGPFFLALPSAT
jgi:DNA-binding NarL/FixJ family response regulator